MTAPDFAALRKGRNERVHATIMKMAREMGWTEGDNEPIHHTFDNEACYCACASGGPCEHNEDGWRDILDDRGEVCGGECYCTRCGMGAMGHDMRRGL